MWVRLLPRLRDYKVYHLSILTNTFGYGLVNIITIYSGNSGLRWVLPLERIYKFYAYHGTDDAAAEEICASGFQVPAPQRQNDWLGHGLYFFREDPVQAQIWAVFGNANVKQGQRIACVVEAVISIAHSRFLNLDTREGMLKLKDFLIAHEPEFQKITMRFISEAHARHFIFALLPVKDYPVIQRTFSVPSKSLNELPVPLGLNLQGTQVCVRDAIVFDGDPKLYWKDHGSRQTPRKSKILDFPKLT